jgi:hypothetical protein
VKRKTRYRPGRIKQQLGALLCSCGFGLDERNFRSAEGFYRITRRYDDTTVCWEVSAWRPNDEEEAVFWPPPRHRLMSHHTMSDCVRYGITVSRSEDGSRNVWWVDANKPAE